MGRSSAHAGNVALVMNPKTGLVSPQFQVVFDDDFTTVSHLRKGTVPQNWERLVTGSREKSTEEFFDLTKTWFEPIPDASADEIMHSTTTDSEGDPTGPIMNSNEGDSDQPTIILFSEGDPEFPASNTSEGAPRPTVTLDSEGEHDKNDLFMPEMMNLQTAGFRRSERLATKGQPKYNFFSGISKFCAFGTLLAPMLLNPIVAFSYGQASVNAVIHNCNIINANFDGLLNEFHHMVLAATKANNENYTFREMLQQDDAGEFIKAMMKEVGDHEARGHWETINRSQMPPGTKTIQAIWSFKRKRFPDGTLNKHKARLCAHGRMQQWGVNYWETYAPVVNWISVRFLLVLSEIIGLESRAIDFVLAFP